MASMVDLTLESKVGLLLGRVMLYPVTVRSAPTVTATAQAQLLELSQERLAGRTKRALNQARIFIWY